MSKTESSSPTLFSRLVGLAGMLSVHLLAMLFVCFVMIKIVPTYAFVFQANEFELPVTAINVIYWSDFWVAYWYLLLFLLLAVDTGIVILLGLIARWPRVLSCYSHLCLLIALTLVVYTSAILTIPVYSFAVGVEQDAATPSATDDQSAD